MPPTGDVSGRRLRGCCGLERSFAVVVGRPRFRFGMDADLFTVSLGCWAPDDDDDVRGLPIEEEDRVGVGLNGGGGSEGASCGGLNGGILPRLRLCRLIESSASFPEVDRSMVSCAPQQPVESARVVAVVSVSVGCMSHQLGVLCFLHGGKQCAVGLPGAQELGEPLLRVVSVHPQLPLQVLAAIL